MTEDEILAAADAIRARRKHELQWRSFCEQTEVMIRWSVPYAKYGQSSVSIIVPRDGPISSIVADYFAPLI